eukprot:TRINITY_DN27887_c0_g1_i2.p1 TRINITY_DN27887_c0_g1~~TRINITY_DN27887_c0_g1_i2.p1  ORF type:complete len:286 (-),score=68.06 TRINITY_DN27887_c0_g1_i2:38-844(-)
MAKLLTIPVLLNILAATAFRTKTCDHDQVTTALKSNNECTTNAIKPTVQSLAMKAGDTVDDSAIDQTCALLKKDGPIMTCAKDNLGKCFEIQDLDFNLKLGGQHSPMLSMQCYSDDTQMAVENDIFFAWLELEGIFTDKNASTCTIEAVDTNIAFQECTMNQDKNLIEDTKDVKKAKETATNSFMKCFDETENPCFSEREMTFLRKEFKNTIEGIMAVMFGMGDINMNDDKEDTNQTRPSVKDTSNSNSLLPMISLTYVAVFMFLCTS